MKKVIGAGIALIGAMLAIGVFLWLFISGVESIVDEINAENANGANIAWGILKIIFAGTIGWATFWACAALGFLVADE